MSDKHTEGKMNGGKTRTIDKITNDVGPEADRSHKRMSIGSLNWRDQTLTVDASLRLVEGGGGRLGRNIEGVCGGWSWRVIDFGFLSYNLYVVSPERENIWWPIFGLSPSTHASGKNGCGSAGVRANENVMLSGGRSRDLSEQQWFN